MSDAIGLINALSNMGGSISFLESFSFDTRNNIDSKTFSCGNFSYGLLYIQACGTKDNSSDNMYNHDSFIFINLNMSEVYIYASLANTSSSGVWYTGDYIGTVASTSNSITVKLFDKYYFISGSVICFN